MQKLLLVEDDTSLLAHLRSFLCDDWEVIVANDGAVKWTPLSRPKIALYK
ncbi:MAG: hypothetical protein HRU09_14930 [Oligoflexales bacterium]|nr:hypothetical protein [Oligoflexales bacterium]